MSERFNQIPLETPVSQIPPDIPELKGIPEVLRSAIWMKAYLIALKRRNTWALGLICLMGLASICGSLGYQVVGIFGAILGAITGSVIGILFFIRIVLEWQAKRWVPEVRSQREKPKRTFLNFLRIQEI